MEKINYLEAIESLEDNIMKNIVLLKHATMLKNNAEYYTEDNLVGIKFNPYQTQHDRNDYSNYDSINILSSNSNENILNYLELFHNCKCILKINGSFENDKCTLLRSFQSLSTNQNLPTKVINEICNENQIETDEYAHIFSINNYTINDIKLFINNHNALVLSIKRNDKPIVSCVVYQVYKNVWEIAALATIEKYRRQNLAEQLVTYATNYILGNDCIPRYHVYSKNFASLKLAQKCGYKTFLEFNHYGYNGNR